MLEGVLSHIHSTLEGLLRDTFKVEDGARLASLQSHKACQDPLDGILTEFKQLMEQMDLQKNDAEVLGSL